MKKELGKTAPVRLLLVVLALAVSRLSAVPIHVVLSSDHCGNVSLTEMACNYTNTTEKVLLDPQPNACDKWNTLTLIGAQKLDITISCFPQIIVSSSDEVEVTVFKDEKEHQRTLKINNSNVTNLQGPMGKVYITDSRVNSLTAPRLSELNLINSRARSLNSVVVGNFNFVNSTIESVNHLQVVGDKPSRMTGGEIGAVKHLTFDSSSAYSTLEQVVINSVSKGGIQLRNGILTLTNVTIRSLETEAIGAHGGTVTFINSTIEKGLVDSVTLDNEGTLQLMNTYIGGTKYNFLLISSSLTFPFILADLFWGFSTGWMVGSAFLGALILLTLALIVLLALKCRRNCKVSPNRGGKDLAAIESRTLEDSSKVLTELTLVQTPWQDRRLNLPAPPPPPEEDGENDSKSSFGQMSKPPGGLPPGLGRLPQPPNGRPPVLGQPPQPPSGPPPSLGQGSKSPIRPLPGLLQNPDLPKGPHPRPGDRPPLLPPNEELKLESLKQGLNDGLHDSKRYCSDLDPYDDVGPSDDQVCYDNVGPPDDQEPYDDVNRI